MAGKTWSNVKVEKVKYPVEWLRKYFDYLIVHYPVEIKFGENIEVTVVTPKKIYYAMYDLWDEKFEYMGLDREYIKDSLSRAFLAGGNEDLEAMSMKFTSAFFENLSMQQFSHSENKGPTHDDSRVLFDVHYMSELEDSCPVCGG